MKNMMMMKTILIMVLLFSGLGLRAGAFPPEDLPRDITSFVNTHFPGQQIMEAERTLEDEVLYYELELEQGVEMKFNEMGEVLSIESESRIPDSALPEKIVSFLSENYPDTYVVEWEWEDEKHSVELDDGSELEFNSEGVFIGEDTGIF